MSEIELATQTLDEATVVIHRLMAEVTKLRELLGEVAGIADWCHGCLASNDEDGSIRAKLEDALGYKVGGE